MSSIQRRVQSGLFLLLLVLIALLLLGQLLGQPMLVFVETGSMEPTLEPGDGYVAVPSQFAGEIEEGDVILFEAEELGDGGGLTTHRVDDITEEGYITKGDANPFTDQESDEPPVQEGQIKSVGLTIGGELVTIPELGTAKEMVSGATETLQNRLFSTVGLESPGNQTFVTGLLGVSLLFLVLTSVGTTATDHRGARSQRKITRDGTLVVLVVILVVIVPLNLSMLLPSGVYQYEIVSSANPDDTDEQIIEAGTSDDVTYSIENGGQIPVFAILEPAGDGVHISQPEQYVSRQSTANVSVTMDAPAETGTHYRYVKESRYVVLLPPSLIATLHGVHPVVALVAINLPVALVVSITGMLAIGTGRLRLRSRSRGLSIRQQFKRRLPWTVRSRSKRTVPSPRWEREEPTPTVTAPPPVRDESTPPVESTLDQPSIRRYEWLDGVLETAPSEVGLDGETWTSGLLRTFLERSSEDHYTRVECQRVLGEHAPPVLRVDQINRDRRANARNHETVSDDEIGGDH
ncbi:signal peptidase I [Halostagnicola kamekurae]|uniref:Signal peptidase, endoplasmic reticulum-type n=1 Tax=Halostagnicola kamekurae TaxID=619731 RepID=A0A1I6U9W3_9EURY|nr:signal peptidase I [Halostagnicola kamekurae]SFS98202.1 signal peptidase, endoplasmic reticulum-type [Halostagnicola kamekurae]